MDLHEEINTFMKAQDEAEKEGILDIFAESGTAWMTREQLLEVGDG